MDRMGDTFRWRGENVSTIEVESVISSVLEQTDSVVYGVDVPGVEGKAGMAAIVEDAAKFDLDRFLINLKAELPSYAIPLFVRLVTSLDITGQIILPIIQIYFFDCRNIQGEEARPGEGRIQPLPGVRPSLLLQQL